MADVNTDVLALVERELKKDPDARSTDLQAKAAKVDKSVEELTGRQFHARYALQARRKLFGGGATKPRKTKSRARARQSSDPVVELLTDSYKDKRAELNEAIDEAFRRALEADSVKKINSVLSSIDRKIREFERI